MAYTQKHTKSSFPFKTSEKVKANMKKPTKEESKLKIGGFGEGGSTSGSTRKIVVGGEVGYKSKYGDISLKPGFISEKGKYHNINKGDLKLGYTANFNQIKNIFKR